MESNYIATQAFVDAVCEHNGQKPTRDIPASKSHFALHSAESLSSLISQLNPDCGYEEWTKIGMAIHHETGGSDAGLTLFDAWSATGKTYPGASVITAKWRSFHDNDSPRVTLGTLIFIARAQGVDVDRLLACDPERFEPIGETEVIFPGNGGGHDR